MSAPRPASPSQLGRRIGQALLVAFMGMVVVGVLLREPRLTDVRYWLVRWPVWLVLGVGAPFLALRIALWQRRRRARREAGEDGSNA